MFFYDSYETRWVRRLLKTSAVTLEISMTGEWGEIAEECIRLTHTDDRVTTFHDHLPDDVWRRMVDRLGILVAHRLVYHNYVKEFGLLNIVAASLRHPGEAGVPAEEIFITA